MQVFATAAAVITAMFAVSTVTATDKLTHKQYQELALFNGTTGGSNPQEGIVADPMILSGTVVPRDTKTYTTGIRSSAYGYNFCGGSLITPTHVLTAGHCLDGNIQYVSVGSHYLSGTRDGEQIRVKRITRHPEWTDDLAHDFMILELESSSSFPPVALAAADGSDVVTGSMATVMGWGDTSQDGSQSNELLRLNVPIVSDSVCARVLDIDETMFCAGGMANRDSCQGDSGGPLISEKSSGDVLIGVVSWGTVCGLRGYPGVYARVSGDRQWISSVAPGTRFL